MTKEKTKIVMIVLVCLFVLSFLFVSQSKADVETEKEKFNYHLMVPLPTASGTVTEVEGITDYIKTIYLFAMGIAGILAMALIVVSGFQWLTATGSMSTIGQAKARISNAILGLIVLLSAYLILNTINPNLVNLKEPVLLFLDWTEEFGNAAGGTPPGGGTKPDWCFDTAADGTKTLKTGNCREIYKMGGHINSCNANPCGVATNCYLAVGKALCDACDGSTDPVNTGYPIDGCNHVDYETRGYLDPTACAADPCGVGPCKWEGHCKSQ